MKTATWRQAWEESDLPPRHRRVLSGLTHSMGASGGEHGTCYPGALLLSRRCGYDERKVRQTLRELDGGWLTIYPRPGQAARYYARLPEPGWVLPEAAWSLGGRQAIGDTTYPSHWDSGVGTPESANGSPASGRRKARRRDADEIRETQEIESSPPSKVGSLNGSAASQCPECGKPTMTFNEGRDDQFVGCSDCVWVEQ